MMLFAAGPLYMGLKSESFWDYWVERDTVCVHLGNLCLQWDCRLRSDGPTQTNPHQSQDRATAQGHQPVEAVGPGNAIAGGRLLPLCRKS